MDFKYETQVLTLLPPKDSDEKITFDGILDITWGLIGTDLNLCNSAFVVDSVTQIDNKSVLVTIKPNDQPEPQTSGKKTESVLKNMDITAELMDDFTLRI